MKSLKQKIFEIHSTLARDSFSPNGGTILLAIDGDGNNYIAKWEHPTLAKPTDEQLAAVGE
jgi:hypothetical protein